MGDDRWHKFRSKRCAMWPRGKTSSDIVCKKIEAAFYHVKSFPLERIVFQFWRPFETTSGVTVLSCSGTPFALSVANRRLRDYRLRSSLYYCGLIGAAVVAEDAEEDPMIIKDSPQAMAFQRRFPEVVLDLQAHSRTPLVDIALESELACFMMLPLYVFETSSCVGVIEVSVTYSRHLLVIYDDLYRELNKVGLSIARPSAISLPCLPIPGRINLVRSEVEKALKVAVESHSLTLGQVWTPYYNHHNGVTGKVLGKVWSYWVDNSDGMSLVKNFYSSLLCIPLHNGMGLVEGAIRTRQPHLCRNIYKFTGNKGLTSILSANTKSACFVICMASIHTGAARHHVFEFFWPQQRNHLALIETLILTLKEHLPSFRYANGGPLGQMSYLADVEPSCSGSGSTYVMIFTSLFEKVSVGMKRKTRASARIKRESQSASNQYPLANINNNPKVEQHEDEDDDDLVILAVYKVHHSLFFLPSSATFESLMEKAKQEFDTLNPAGMYKIEYQVLPGEWYTLMDDTCLKNCISSYRAAKNIDHIKLLVLEEEN